MNTDIFTFTRNIVIASVLMVGMNQAVYADMLYGIKDSFSGRSQGPYYYFQVTDTSKGTKAKDQQSEWWLNTRQGENLTTGQELQYFCVDYHANLSSAFYNPATGQSYDVFAFMDSPFSAKQQEAIQSLYNHTYSHLLDAQASGAMTSLINTSLFDFYSIAIQLAVWEIIHENPATTSWNISSGSFSVILHPKYNGNAQAPDDFAEYARLVNSWLDSIVTGVWDPTYADETLWELTYFYAGTASQAQIAVTGGGGGPTAVPEPGTMLILGLGLVGLPFARRLRKR